MAVPDCTKFHLRLNQQRFTGEFCDAQISSRDGKEFMAHIPVLAAASKHFKREFTSGFKEAKDGKVNLDMDATIVEHILQYIYTYNITIDESIAIRLLPEARYLQLSGLKQRCAKLLLTTVTQSNCIEMWSYARLYFCSELRDHAWKMMCSNFDSLIDTPEFLGLEIDDLLSFLADKSLVRGDSIAFSGVCNWVRADPENRKQHMNELVRLISRRNWKPLGTWTDGPQLEVNMHSCSAAVFDGRIYCASEQMAVLSQGSWRTIAPPFDGIDWKGWKLCVVDDSMYAIGVADNNRHVYKFQKESETWTLVHRAIGNNGFISLATAYNNRICVADNSTKTIETFHPSQPDSGFVRLCSFPAGLGSSFALCEVDGRLMTVGGWTGDKGAERTDQVYIFDPLTASWNTGACIGECRGGTGATECGGRLVIAGGFNESFMNEVQMLVGGEWKPLQSLQHPRHGCAVAVLDNVIYVIGGYRAPQSVEMLRFKEED